MVARTPCRYCGKIGFVRREHVVKGERITVSYYCGACDRAWEVGDERTHTRPKTQKDEPRSAGDRT